MLEKWKEQAERESPAFRELLESYEREAHKRTELQQVLERLVRYCETWQEHCETGLKDSSELDEIRREYLRTKAHVLGTVACILTGELSKLEKAVRVMQQG